MSWLARLRGDDEPDEQQAPEPDEDSPAALQAAIDELVRYVNARAGGLPPAALVNARMLTDTLTEVVDSAAVRPLDVYAVISVRGVVGDYLPTTLRGYLALEPDARGVPRADGHSPTQSLMMQIDSLQTSVSATLVATREQDADALMTQGRFLQTKFNRSDLDL
ncbi:hypothetical protein [Cellulomonas rhizosphaerae]|uniref:Uncharacterized protein n=1 Tax=Cellulomonas rhizosphaerae TaxID=2293719 RepID=A0A413RRL1_9CELL|nr:hypothetical protein [Cellulomonas rhizosphaerae]RHA44560.1 hypothetical protein D1825_00585 [Cellulomonas rhizosphaerae]